MALGGAALVRAALCVVPGALACGELAGFEEFTGDASAVGGMGGGRSDEAGASGRGGRKALTPPIGGSPQGAAPGGGGVDSGGGGSAGATASNGGTTEPQSAGTGGAVPPAHAGQSGSQGTTPCGELLANGDFEAGNSQWTEASTLSPNFEIVIPAADPRLVAEGVTPRAGDYLAWLGGIPDDDYDKHRVTLTQNVSIPGDSTRLVLRGYRWIRTDETDAPEEEPDHAVLELAWDGYVLWQAALWTSDEPTNGWEAFEVFTTELNSLRGRTVTLYAEGRTDWYDTTHFWLDSLALEAECGR